jgi:hypothetical protein
VKAHKIPYICVHEHGYTNLLHKFCGELWIFEIGTCRDNSRAVVGGLGANRLTAFTLQTYNIILYFAANDAVKHEMMDLRYPLVWRNSSQRYLLDCIVVILWQYANLRTAPFVCMSCTCITGKNWYDQPTFRTRLHWYIPYFSRTWTL